MKHSIISLLLATAVLFLSNIATKAQISSVSQNSISWAYNDISTKYITIYCNGPWQLDTASVSGNSHFLVSQTSGSGNSAISVTPICANNGSSDILDYLGIEGLYGGFADIALTHSADPINSGGDPAFVTISPSSLEWTANDLSAKAVVITTEGSMWWLASSSSSAYYNINPIQGASGATVWISPKSVNETYSNITRNLSFASFSSGLSDVLTLVQDGLPPFVQASESEVIWLADDLSEKVITVTASGNWNASISGTGFLLSSNSGTGTGSVTITPTSFHYGDHPRTATISICCENATATVSLVQKQSDQRFGIEGNWILERSFIQSPEASYYDDIVFYDGLGYEKQVVQVGASPQNGKNIVTPIVYDAVRRADAKTYLPFVSDGSTAVEMSSASALTGQSTFYQNEGGRAFAEKHYEKSALDRPLWARKEGKAYFDSTKIVSFIYGANTANEVLAACVDTCGALCIAGHYAAGSLHKTTSIDEENSTQIVFMDKSGNVVLQRSVSGNQYLDTYYVYDQYGNIAWVVSPEGSARLVANTIWAIPAESDINTSDASKYCYVYKNNAFGWPLYRKLPGKAAEYLFYDNGGRVIRNQDGLLRNEGLWMVHSYDNLGREVGIGLSNNNAAGQGTIQTTLIQTRYGTYTGIASELVFQNPSELSSSISINTALVKGLKTYERVALLDPDYLDHITGYVQRAFYYDANGRVCQVVELYPDGHLSRTSTVYDLRGKISEMLESHTDNFETHYLKTCYTYDKRGRAKNIQRILDGETLTPVFYSYDNLGRHSLTTIGDATSSGVIGSQSFQYDLRGWLLGSNAQLDNNTVFGELLRYENPSNSNSIARWDGNISESSITRFDGNVSPLTYSHGYSYDGFKRLSNAIYRNGSGTPLSLMTEKDITYDRNGNVTGLKRYDVDGVLDELHFTHSGNRIYEVANNTWSYDDNGNMTHNASQDLDLEYNLLNLPREARHMNDTVSYQYLADGTKLSALTNVGDGLKYRGNFVYEIIAEPVDWYDDLGNHITDPILWESLASIAWDEGRIAFQNPLAPVDSIAVEEILPDGGFSPAYMDEWHVRDHLGSVRAIVKVNGDSISATDRILEINDYLPFGSRIPTDFQASTNRHRFSGKEEQRFGSLDLGMGGDRIAINLLDFGARYYDPFTCRWTTMDPMAGKYSNVSPYIYCHNNPLSFLDPDGQADYFNNKGELIFRDMVDDGRILITSQEVIDAARSAMNNGLLGQESYDILNAGSMTFSAATKGDNSYLSEEAALRVYEHYNYTGLPISIDDSIGQDMQFTAPGAQAQIKINNENNLHGEHFFDNSYNIINSFTHEYKHWLDYKKHGRSVFAESNKPVIELRAIKYQKDHSSWAKTTDGYKKGIDKYETKQLEKWKRKR